MAFFEREQGEMISGTKFARYVGKNEKRYED